MKQDTKSALLTDRKFRLLLQVMKLEKLTDA